MDKATAKFNDKTAIERLMSKINVTNGCWEWKGSLSDKDYGRMRINGKKFLAHRVSYMLFKGKIPDGLFILHECDNHRCVNPKHLHLGTAKENLHEAIQRGRALIGNLNPMMMYPKRGETNNNVKLTEVQVKEIIQLVNNGVNHKEIAAKFGVSSGNISSIKNNKSWKHLKRAELLVNK